MRQIRIYNQVFRVEKTVYSMQGVHLPFPVSYRQMAFFVGALFIMILLNKFPPISWIDLFLVKFIAIPVLVAWFFTRKTLDGKAPHRFLLRYLEHFFAAHHFARYRELEHPHRSGYQYAHDIAYRKTTRGES
ncbi:conjugal transfer protein [Hazenella sp. IB182357]|uniref:Conjugal transfer protein n=1 Tax=Polycladospora coralii TaxID=2771432 RepID=A0A926N9A6_9BACL|nr:TcpE family conjugal transfer membrane protein [Polycladospora coralii]MBD1370835.1 conjugal transfer protein [Polycladospora coralii]MBS7529774.1 conjugal transfer protein [Polycladospora coralii]